MIKILSNCLLLIFTAHKQPCSSLGRHGNSSREKLQQKELLRGDTHRLLRFINTFRHLLTCINLAFSRGGKKSKPIGGLLQWHGDWSNVWDSEKGLRPWILQVIGNLHFRHEGLCFFMFVNLFNVFVSFGHELAHTFGLAHDRRVSRRSSRKYLFFSITNIAMILVIVIITL